ncbi:MAG: hypothetical protein KDJ86_13675 [Bauldia sp.]|uniref:hypothetical protein n=1 Tax=Bauldia sp. TaxID=2575872 RepID=UPI001E0F0EA8|nr:hypothetical protein [Bauldia sp.]MCB1496832.1 hypothetical protein [Bauldia sp.]
MAEQIGRFPGKSKIAVWNPSGRRRQEHYIEHILVNGSAWPEPVAVFGGPLKTEKILETPTPPPVAAIWAGNGPGWVSNDTLNDPIRLD